MTNYNVGGWLLVALVIVGLALVAPVVSAHSYDTIPDDAPGNDGPAAEWAGWMDGHVIDHMGPGAVERMESHTDVTPDEMARDVAHGGHGSGMDGQGRNCYTKRQN